MGPCPPVNWHFLNLFLQESQQFQAKGDTEVQKEDENIKTSNEILESDDRIVEEFFRDIQMLENL